MQIARLKPIALQQYRIQIHFGDGKCYLELTVN